MRRVLTEPGKKKPSALNWIVCKPTTNQSNAVTQQLCIAQFSTTELTYFRSKVTSVASFTWSSMSAPKGETTTTTGFSLRPIFLT